MDPASTPTTHEPPGCPRGHPVGWKRRSPWPAQATCGKPPSRVPIRWLPEAKPSQELKEGWDPAGGGGQGGPASGRSPPLPPGQGLGADRLWPGGWGSSGGRCKSHHIVWGRTDIFSTLNLQIHEDETVHFCICDAFGAKWQEDIEGKRLLMSKFIKVPGSEISIQKPTVFLYVSNAHSNNKTEKTVPFITALKRIKQFRGC
ncbi:unnamed protein product [Nyctereutes procyonoides]|uniref:(raccoon dog) hypothetical protein n=1 Tax=Nyctereutes procyonoides TaxID=34880 RepID=A0A811YJR3_NYCPR|nr:unnamed protein product [Nyctereutes procyonoides]